MEFPYKLKNGLKDGVYTEKKKGGDVGAPCIFQWQSKGMVFTSKGGPASGSTLNLDNVTNGLFVWV